MFADNALGARSLLLFTGKGGVGKSSIVAGVALASAKQGRRPLIVELGHRASMEAIFGGQRIGSEPVQVSAGVHAVNLDLDANLRHYFREHIPIKRAGEAIVNNETLQRFFKAAPAVSEVATLNRLRSFVEAKDGGQKRWDPVIVDLDATGHALMLFNLPKVMNDLVGKGPLRPLIDGFARLFSSPEQTALNLVTLAQELPMQETKELLAKLAADHAIPLGLAVINQMPRDLLSSQERALLAQLNAVPLHHPGLARELKRLADKCEQYEHACALRDDFVQGLKMPHVVIPRYQIGEVRELGTLTAMGRALFETKRRVA